MRPLFHLSIIFPPPPVAQPSYLDSIVIGDWYGCSRQGTVYASHQVTVGLVLHLAYRLRKMFSFSIAWLFPPPTHRSTEPRLLHRQVTCLIYRNLPLLRGRTSSSLSPVRPGTSFSFSAKLSPSLPPLTRCRVPVLRTIDGALAQRTWKCVANNQINQRRFTNRQTCYSKATSKTQKVPQHP